MHILNLNVISSELGSGCILEFGCFGSCRTELKIFSGFFLSSFCSLQVLMSQLTKVSTCYGREGVINS